MSNFIAATAWVPRGFAAPFPTKYAFDEEEFARIQQLAKLQLDEAKEDLEEAKVVEKNRKSKGTKNEDAMSEDGGEAEKPSKIGKADNEDDDDDLKEYDLEHYDDDEEEAGDGEVMGMFGNHQSLAYHSSNAEDPYITMNPNEDDDEEREELQILPTDNMLLAAKVEDEVPYLEVYVYEDSADNLYVHHDFMLPALPLCVEWLDLPVGGKAGVEKDGRANFVAVGTMDPDIEIWDLDTMDCMYPNAILGQGSPEAASKTGLLEPAKKKKKKSKKANDNYHVDAVLSLAANRHHRNLLASSSADKTVKLWDLNTTTCAKSYSHHTDKVCSLAWHPKESTVLLSGSYDRTVVAADMRSPDAKAPRWGVESDVESVRWDPHSPNHFYITTEAGLVHYHDVRNAPKDPSKTKPVWTLNAHDESVSSFDVNPHISGFLVTGSTDKTVKLWNITPEGPNMVVSRNLEVGKVFSTTFGPDEEVGFRLAVAGSKGTVTVWDTSTNKAVRQAFAGRVQPVDGEVEERIVGVQADSDEESDDEEEGEEEGSADEEGVHEKGWESMDED